MAGYMNQDYVKIDDIETVKSQHGRPNRANITVGECKAQGKGQEKLREEKMDQILKKVMANGFPANMVPAS